MSLASLRAFVTPCLRAVLLCVTALVFLTGCEKSIRIASYNASLSREKSGQLLLDLTNPNDPQAKAMADVIQHQNPDVILLTDVDYDSFDRAWNLFVSNYLNLPQSGVPEIQYPYHFTGPVNCGIASGYDLDHDGKVVTTPGTIGFANDALGFGFFPGQHGMMLLSKLPIEHKDIRTFTRFKWNKMPDAQLPTDNNGKSWYTDDELKEFRLATTSFWDVPIKVNDKVVHLVINRPTATGSDDSAHSKTKRNHDEIRFLTDYISGDDRVKPSRTYYIADDTSIHGGMEVWSAKKIRSTADVPFILLGQDNVQNAAALLNHPLLRANASNDRPEILPSAQFKIVGGSTLTPAPATQPVVGSATNQRFVYLDLKF